MRPGVLPKFRGECPKVGFRMSRDCLRERQEDGSPRWPRRGRRRSGPHSRLSSPAEGPIPTGSPPGCQPRASSDAEVVADDCADRVGQGDSDRLLQIIRPLARRACLLSRERRRECVTQRERVGRGECRTRNHVEPESLRASPSRRARRLRTHRSSAAPCRDARSRLPRPRSPSSRSTCPSRGRSSDAPAQTHTSSGKPRVRERRTRRAQPPPLSGEVRSPSGTAEWLPRGARTSRVIASQGSGRG